MSVSIRSNKRAIMSLMYYSVFRASWIAKFNERHASKPSPEAQAKLDTLLEEIMPTPVPAVCITVARKKDGVVVGTYDTLEAANEAIAKAKAAKKAALEIVE